MIVYRGATLTGAAVDDYKSMIGKRVKWLPFVSTSKSRLAAEFFSSNTLFIMK
ncbi:unnamed protein product, partial [Rotaria sp. Silwood2]